MAERELKYAKRYTKRQFAKGAASLAKILTELITNADDSYRRQEQDDPVASMEFPGFGTILVQFERRSRTFRVIDQAEGLSSEEMIACFEVYGEDSGDYARGLRTRSLFGQGLRDVLFSQARGAVKSIKNGQAAVCRFRWRESDDKAVIDPRSGPRVTEDLRKSWGIARNGTMVEFILDEGSSLPQHATLVQRLSNFYMLRRINSDPRRRIRLITEYPGGRREEADIRYSMPAGELLQSIHIDFPFERVQRAIEGEVRRFSQQLSQGEVGYEEREGGLLIVDENDAVLDLTLFGFDMNPYATRLFGLVKIHGAGEFIRERLNLPTPQEILTQAREGFDKKSAFYKALQRVMNPILKAIVKAEEAAFGSDAGKRLPAEVKARHNKAFECLNALYRQMVGDLPFSLPAEPEEVSPPAEGLAFEVTELTVSVGVPTPTRLLVDPGKLLPGTHVEVASEGPGVDVVPTGFEVEPPKEGQRVSWKVLRIFAQQADQVALVTAKSGGVSSDMLVTTRNRQVEMKDHVMFDPSTMRLQIGQQRHVILYVDLSAVPEGSVIDLSAEVEDGLVVSVRAVEVERANAGPSVFMSNIKVTGHRLGARGTLEARWRDLECTCTLEVVSKRSPLLEQGSFIQDFAFAHFENKQQPVYLSEEGVLQVNLNEPLNRRYLGSNRESAEVAVACDPLAQMRLAELILDECLWKMVTEAYNGKRLEHITMDAPTDIRHYVLSHKARIGPEVHAWFVSQPEEFIPREEVAVTEE